MAIFFAVSTLFFAALMAVFLTKYLTTKKTLEKQIDDLEQRNKEYLRDNEAAQAQMRQNIASDNKKIEALLNEISTIRKEKEEELKLRIESEKQVAMTIQKTEDIQNRMQDWKIAQDAAMADAQDTMKEISQDLFTRLTDVISQKDLNNLTQNNNNFNEIRNTLHNLSEALEEQKNSTIQAIKNNLPNEIKVLEEKEKNTVDDKTKNTSNPIETAISEEKTGDISKKMITDLVESMKQSGHVNGKEYFTSDSFDSEKAKLFLCETAFLQDDHLYFFDFKAYNFINDYNKSADKDSALKTLTLKLDKYFAYLSNPKYRGAISKIMELKKINFIGSDVVFVVTNESDIDLLEKIHYLAKFEDADIKIATFNDLIEITL